MKKQTRRRNGLAVGAMTLVTFSLGVTVAVFLAGSASASSPTTTSTTSTSATSLGSADDPNSPGARFFVINGTVYAASDHAIVGSSAFPNYASGAVDNYYSLAHSHVDNSPFAEGTATPFDTGPIGQTAAAGNFQQSQYADARWPGGPDKATFGSQGGPYAIADADVYRGQAEASMPSNGLSGPGVKLPKGVDGKLQTALAAWKAKFAGLLGTKKPAPPTVTTPKGTPTVPTKTPTAPTATVPTPVATVTTPKVGGVTPAAPVLPSAPAVPSVPGATAMAPQRSLTGAPAIPAIPGTPKAPSASSSSSDGESLLHSWTLAKLVPVSDIPKDLTDKTDTTKTDTTTTTTTTTTANDPTKTYALLQTGESTLGRVSLGGGQILIHGIHVTASIANAGTPSYNASVSVASASIGGVPVTIDKDGVHIAGHSQSLPYQQASDALNSALKQAGIQIFLVAPEVTDCTQSSGFGFGGGTGGGTDTSTTSTTTTSDQSGTASPCDQGGGMGLGTGCDQTGSGSGSGTPGIPTTTTTTTSSTQTDTTFTNPSSCDQTGTGAGCDQSGTGSGGTGTTTTSGSTGGIAPTKTTTSTTTTTSSNPSGTTGAPAWCNSYSPPPATSACTTKGKTSTSSTNPGTTTTTTTPTDQTGMGTDTANSIEETVRATGVHVVFTQPVQQSGVPAQNVEHIFGEVFVDSLAEPAPPVPPLGDLGLAGSAKSSKSSFSSCAGARAHKSGAKASGSALSAGGSSASGGGSAASGSGSGSAAGGSLASSGSALGASAALPTASSAGSSFPASVVHALKKPLWLLLAYVVWQLLVIGTGASLWHWRRGRAA
jgi:mucin-2